MKFHDGAPVTGADVVASLKRWGTRNALGGRLLAVTAAMDAPDAKTFAMRARKQLAKNSAEWRRATDIVLVSKPTKEDLQALAQEGSVNGPVRR